MLLIGLGLVVQLCMEGSSLAVSLLRLARRRRGVALRGLDDESAGWCWEELRSRLQ